MITTLIFGQLLAAFLLQAHLGRMQGVVAYDDPQRDPNWCWTHNALWPACAGKH
ncbi:hypothetical protein [Streptomyces misionensis]|uniref:hypothetical protein n=1 Tax=Streptomyces misionensis TaxID=67331 RepID=UPI0036C64712